MAEGYKTYTPASVGVFFVPIPFFLSAESIFIMSMFMRTNIIHWVCRIRAHKS